MTAQGTKLKLNTYEVTLRAITDPNKTTTWVITTYSAFHAADLSNEIGAGEWQVMHVMHVKPAASLPTTDNTPDHAGV